jgi:hypothetical protein|tara:strand:+ start:73707 stop:74027 length:321 start_codon:yes stop_codon:yes gene_type:complete
MQKNEGKNMATKNNGFLKRADEHISLANEQLEQEITQGEVSASFMYGAARFNAWIASTSFANAQDMANEKDKIIEYFVNEYKLALAEHIDNHVSNYDFSQNNIEEE